MKPGTCCMVVGIGSALIGTVTGELWWAVPGLTAAFVDLFFVGLDGEWNEIGNP